MATGIAPVAVDVDVLPPNVFMEAGIAATCGSVNSKEGVGAGRWEDINQHSP